MQPPAVKERPPLTLFFLLSMDFLSLSSLYIVFSPHFFFLCPSVCRPGGCPVQGSRFSSSTTLPDEVLNFVKTHPLMDETVPLLGHRPWVVKTMGRYAEWLSHLIGLMHWFFCGIKIGSMNMNLNPRVGWEMYFVYLLYRSMYQGTSWQPWWWTQKLVPIGTAQSCSWAQREEPSSSSWWFPVETLCPTAVCSWRRWRDLTQRSE